MRTVECSPGPQVGQHYKDTMTAQSQAGTHPDMPDVTRTYNRPTNKYNIVKYLDLEESKS